MYWYNISKNSMVSQFLLSFCHCIHLFGLPKMQDIAGGKPEFSMRHAVQCDLIIPDDYQYTSTDGQVQHFHTFTQFKWYDLIG